MRMRTARRMKKQMKAFVKEQYDEELRGMCAYKFVRRLGIALRIILGRPG
jgi:hypothetical protein